MSWQVIIRPKAEADLLQAFRWYESKHQGLGGEFLDEAHHAMRLLEADPERRPIYYRGFRRLITKRFPYKIFYLAEGGRVSVFRILHASRKHEWLLK